MIDRLIESKLAASMGIGKAVEERDRKLSAFEFKWNPGTKTKEPKLFLDSYPNSSYLVIHRENFEDFLLQKN